MKDSTITLNQEELMQIEGGLGSFSSDCISISTPTVGYVPGPPSPFGPSC